MYAVHKRTLLIAITFVVGGFLLARLDPKTKHVFNALPEYYRWGLHLSCLFFLPGTIFSLSVMLDRMSVYLAAAPFVVWLEPDLNLSMKEVLRYLLMGK